MTWARHASPVVEHGRIAEARAVEKVHCEIQNGRAARTVAVHAADADDCRELLEMLGLAADEGKRALQQQT
ncbi:hypothetical protein NLX83_19265 [Allokutzneria sp. A3M-2-11 16]|uniref:hypothetical protein n=1 Tax=Allokutzneria sp. A3M-2-11 16 TaxID=2962043 RepID=UPI0020B692CD|nr:hypothetical protein [Allokutzneria sp. A3M-2-11 16]MCP3801401.1 hypothetical protein [Allokutzneria sp. A3M-2-11 16]